jgi:hypothetical protein
VFVWEGLKRREPGKQCHAKLKEEEGGKTLKEEPFMHRLRQNAGEKRQGKELRVL